MNQNNLTLHAPSQSKNGIPQAGSESGIYDATVHEKLNNIIYRLQEIQKDAGFLKKVLRGRL